MYYPQSQHLQTAFAHLGYRQGDFPLSEHTAERIFSLPMHPYLGETEIAAIAEAIKARLE